MANINYITGASGFVGSNLLNKIDAIKIPHEEIATFKLKDFDKLLFCSAYGNMSDHINDDMIVKANLLDLISLLQQLKDLKFNSFVYISTSSVKLPVQTMYSRTKRAGEEICMAYVDKGYPITIIRPYTVCGKGDNEKHLIPVLIKAAIYGTEVNLCEGSHDFIDIDDLTNEILNIKCSGIFELGSGISTTNEQVLRIVELVTGKKLKVNKVPQMRSYDTDDWVCKTNYKPRKNLEVSIQEMYDQIRSNN
jgi:nucleoside-diphosphate-sugar epimerase